MLSVSKLSCSIELKIKTLYVFLMFANSVNCSGLHCTFLRVFPKGQAWGSSLDFSNDSMSLIRYGLQTGVAYLSIGLSKRLQRLENTTRSWLLLPMDRLITPNTLFALLTVVETCLLQDKSYLRFDLECCSNITWQLAGHHCDVNEVIIYINNKHHRL